MKFATQISPLLNYHYFILTSTFIIFKTIWPLPNLISFRTFHLFIKVIVLLKRMNKLSYHIISYHNITSYHSIFQVFTIQEFKTALNYNCYSLPLWVLFLGNFSQLTMMINSSANFFIYCLMSGLFRDCLREAFVNFCKMVGCKKVTSWTDINFFKSIFWSIIGLGEHS